MADSLIRIEISDRPTPIPYHSAKRDDGENFGYFPLRTKPSAIDEVPELFGESHMKEFIKDLNSPNGLFETVRMLHWYRESNGQHQRVLCFGFVFRDRSLFHELQNCFLFSQSLYYRICTGKILSDHQLVMEICPGTFVAENQQGWIMDLYVCGEGQTQESAHLRLDEHLRGLTAFFRNESDHNPL